MPSLVLHLNPVEATVGNPASDTRKKTEKRRKKYEQRLGPGVYLPREERLKFNEHVAKAAEEAEKAAKAAKAEKAAKAAKAKAAKKDAKAEAKPEPKKEAE